MPFIFAFILFVLLSNRIQAAEIFPHSHWPLRATVAETEGIMPFEIRPQHCYFRSDTNIVPTIITHALRHDPKLKKKPSVDIGCGRGHLTIEFVEHGFVDMMGLDIDEEVIDYASMEYDENRFRESPKNSRFKAINILEQNTFKELFSFLTLLHVACEFKFKTPLLKQLYTMAAPGAILAIVDFAHTNTELPHKLYTYEDMPDHPLLLDLFTDELTKTGWNVVAIKDLTSNFIDHCDTFKKHVARLWDKATQHPARSKLILADYGAFSVLHKQLNEGVLGGVLIIAQKPKD